MNSPETAVFEQICVIVNLGLGSRVLHSARNCGVPGGTVLLGKGTIKNRLLDFFGLSEVEKEIILMVADANTAHRALDRLDKEFKFDKPNHGIAFTTFVCSLAGTRSCKGGRFEEESGAGYTMYHAITVIVDKGSAEYVIDAATSAGSTGGTILNSRGSGIHETCKLFSMDIEPEKEIVLILSEKEKTEAIVSSIRERLKLDEPGKGILYIQDVNRAYGLYK